MINLSKFLRSIHITKFSFYLLILLIILSFSITFYLLLPNNQLVKDPQNLQFLLLADVIFVLVLLSMIIRQILLVFIYKKRNIGEPRLYIKFVNLFTAMALGPAIGWTEEGIEAMERKNVSAVQTVYNILEQTPGNELIEMGAEKDVGILVRVPDASGILTGKVDANTKIDEKDHRSVRKGEWIRASLKKVEELRPIAERNDLSITELAIKFIISKNPVSSVLPTVISEEEIEKFAAMSDGNYINSSDMKEIDELYNSWWKESPYELKATVQ